jgi:wyosine [tRNA(Phe)-imidazoG37] synthetase (radical SAM superfamily)
VIPTAIETPPPAGTRVPTGPCTSGGCLRNFFQNRFVYTVVSPRARGLSVGVDLTPDARCNFDCAYCEVDRHRPRHTDPLDLDTLAAELNAMLTRVHTGELGRHPPYDSLPSSLQELRHVAISGDGEPTLSERFAEAIETVIHVRACRPEGFFKLVLLTNGSRLDQPEVERGLSLLTSRDEIWVKLDAGTQPYMDRINQPEITTLEAAFENILTLGRRRPVTIQSLFPSLHGQGPTPDEIAAYAERLRSLREQGAQIRSVQIYSATRPTNNPAIGHLPLQVLSGIARTVRRISDLKAEVF